MRGAAALLVAAACIAAGAAEEPLPDLTPPTDEGPGARLFIVDVALHRDGLRYVSGELRTADFAEVQRVMERLCREGQCANAYLMRVHAPQLSGAEVAYLLAQVPATYYAEISDDAGASIATRASDWWEKRRPEIAASVEADHALAGPFAHAIIDARLRAEMLEALARHAAELPEAAPGEDGAP